MRLILASPRRPMPKRTIIYLCTHAVVGVACLVWAFFTPVRLVEGIYLLLPVVLWLVARYRIRRYVARLREQGYDVSQFEHDWRLTTKPRIRVDASPANAPRVDVPADEQTVDAEGVLGPPSRQRVGSA